MLELLFHGADKGIVAFIGVLAAYGLTCILLHFCGNLLPRDGGRDYAVDGKLSQGKPRGAGFVFILIFALTMFVFLPIDRERSIYVILTIAAMLTGFLDDCAKAPWGELKKGILDLLISVMIAVTYINFNGSVLSIAFLDMQIVLPKIVFGILATLLVWVSINVTNCADGVDGLSATLTSVTLMSFYFTASSTALPGDYRYMTLLMVACLLGYLWYNATPSTMMMGDAGSRAMGLFIAVIALKSGYVLLYIPFAIVLILDGGLGLLKVSLLRFLKIRILKNTRTPLHDHVRKNLGWSNTQTVYKFAIIQIVVAFAATWLLR
ncbi:MAG: phospho-N-acetylmuramoyl-pentapeptide-transferase [Lachnospiraceae bacterium]|nr:phospho-N-acetylmuramoyl-pentapeptide-transferase [Lachnospiraceae bacterium]